MQDKFLQACNAVQVAIYTIIMHGCYGQTLGKMMMDIKVVNDADEADIGIWQALRRESVTLVLNILWALIVLFVAVVMVLDGFVPKPSKWNESNIFDTSIKAIALRKMDNKPRCNINIPPYGIVMI